MSDQQPLYPFQYGRIFLDLVRGNLELLDWATNNGPSDYFKRVREGDRILRESSK
jgi:hypothetical protein